MCIRKNGSTLGKTAKIRRYRLWMTTQRLDPIIEIVHGDEQNVRAVLPIRLLSGRAVTDKMDRQNGCDSKAESVLKAKGMRFHVELLPVGRFR
jgi:hypothetical protein